MATISKFYLHDAVSPNTGTMPSTQPNSAIGAPAANGGATGSTVARDANDTIGTANPDIESVVTSNADTLAQVWGHRRFVSRPLAAQTLTIASGNWTFSYARSESNLNHNQAIICLVYTWRPSTGAVVDSFARVRITGSEPTVAAAEQADSLTTTLNADVTISDGDILVFDITTSFTQGMATAYTEQFAYDGTTEADTTSCASFVTPPVALTLFTAAAGFTPARRIVGQAVNRAGSY